MLAAAAQIHFAEQARLAQGHHRDSLRLYSRNDTLEALRLQRELCTQLAQGWRPQRSMARGGTAPVPEPPFIVPPKPPQHLLDPQQLQTAWEMFTSRHESMHNETEAVDTLDTHPEPSLAKDTDSEADLVEKHAQEHPHSSEEESEEPQHTQTCFCRPAGQTLDLFQSS